MTCRGSRRAAAGARRFCCVLVLFDSFKLVPRGDAGPRACVAGAVAAVVAALIRCTAGCSRRPALDAAAVLSLRRAGHRGNAQGAVRALRRCARRRSGFWLTRRSSASPSATGFALVENIEYLRACSDAPRSGCGSRADSAPPSCTRRRPRIVAITAKSLIDRQPIAAGSRFCPGWLAAIVLHSAFNHALVSPLLAAAVLMLVLPLVVLIVFDRSERAHARVGGRRSRPRRRAAEARHVQPLRRHAARPLSERAADRAFPAPSSPTCSACCSSISSCRSAPRAC